MLISAEYSIITLIVIVVLRRRMLLLFARSEFYLDPARLRIENIAAEVFAAMACETVQCVKGPQLYPDS